MVRKTNIDLKTAISVGFHFIWGNIIDCLYELEKKEGER